MWSQAYGPHNTPVSLIYIHNKRLYFIIPSPSIHILNLGSLSSIYPWSLSSSVQQFLSSCCLLRGSFSLPLCLCMCVFLHVSVWWTGMTQWCWNERSRAWAFLSKRTIKPYAVHNELTLIQLRCTSCPPVFSLILFPSVLWNSFSFRHAQDIHTRCISRRCHTKRKDLFGVDDHKFWHSLRMV